MRSASDPEPWPTPDVERAGAQGEVLARLAAECFPRPWTAAQFAAELAAPGCRIWWDGAPAAPHAYLLAHRVLEALEIRSLAVAPQARCHGVARRLLGRALAEVGQAGVAVVHLEVREGNAAARALYAAAGFAHAGQRRRYYADGEDALLLRLALDPAKGAGR